jgi:hypothetical protein
MRKMIKAMNNEWTYIICRFIMLKECSSFFQLKYLGKDKCRTARIIKKEPMILT